MANVFFTYYLNDGADSREFEEQILSEVGPRAIAEPSVKQWVLHRTRAWIGASEDAPDYVCVVEVDDLERWATEASASIVDSHGALRSLRRLGLCVSDTAIHVANDGAREASDRSP